MADVSDPAIALLVDRRLVGAAPLQIVVADEIHILALRLRLGEARPWPRKPASNPNQRIKCQFFPFTHVSFAQHDSPRFESAVSRG
jgi:hypothetical protein